MDKEELEKEAEEKAINFANKQDCLKGEWIDEEFSYGKIIAVYEQAYLAGSEPREKRIAEFEKENAELRKIAEFQQSSNMNTHLENKKLKEGLAVGSMWNKHLNSQNKALEEERDRYRNMTFDQREQLTKAIELLKQFLKAKNSEDTYKAEWEAEQFLKDCEVEK